MLDGGGSDVAQMLKTAAPSTPALIAGKRTSPAPKTLPLADNSRVVTVTFDNSKIKDPERLNTLITSLTWPDDGVSTPSFEIVSIPQPDRRTNTQWTYDRPVLRDRIIKELVQKMVIQKIPAREVKGTASYTLLLEPNDPTERMTEQLGQLTLKTNDVPK